MKQVILLREDVDMSKGKATAQGAHASVNATLEASDQNVTNWLKNDAGTKITLSVQSEQELRNLIQKAREANLPSNIVSDLGRTEIEKGTTTAGAIGPANEEKIDNITGHLPLFK